MIKAAVEEHRTIGERTRDAILKSAVDIASAEGLGGLTIGRLAAELGMSKSGLFAHFGSKEELQLATIAAAREIFIEEVISHIRNKPRGLVRLRALCEAWLRYAQREVFRGGCFFAAVSAEFDSRPGAVRDQIALVMREWLDLLAKEIENAKSSGELPGDADAAQIAFELNAITLGANWAFQLYGDSKAFKRARTALLARLEPSSGVRKP